MNQHEILTKLNGLKKNLKHFFSKKNQNVVKIHDGEIDHYMDDLPLTINRDPGPGIKFYTTENSDFSRGLARETPKGIDSFGED